MRINSAQLRRIIKEELARAVNLREANEPEGADDYYGDADPFGDDEAIAKGQEYVPGSGYKQPGDMTIATWNKMKKKPVGFIVDLEGMMSSGGGFYPLYFSDGKTISKISDDVGELGYTISEMLGELGRLPAGIFVAGSSDGGDGPYEITNRA